MGVYEFCVPQGMRVTTATGEHGDVHHSFKIGKSAELVISSGPYFSGTMPEWAKGCEVRRWRTPESKGEDCRVERRGRVSRYITLNYPMGFATYRDVPRSAAAVFDRILDSLCWVSWATVKARP